MEGMAVVDHREVSEDGGNPLARLVTEIGRTAREGWGPTARLIALIAVAAAGVALIVMAGR
jgi:type IV secretory pathway VirB2 component (pilin)